MTIDDSIDALSEALEEAGVDPPQPPAEPPDFDAIGSAISPMSLPEDARRRWERVDPWSWTSMSIELDSHLNDGGALFEWRLEDGGFYLLPLSERLGRR